MTAQGWGEAGGMNTDQAFGGAGPNERFLSPRPDRVEGSLLDTTSLFEHGIPRGRPVLPAW